MPLMHLKQTQLFQKLSTNSCKLKCLEIVCFHRKIKHLVNDARFSRLDCFMFSRNHNIIIVTNHNLFTIYHRSNPCLAVIPWKSPDEKFNFSTENKSEHQVINIYFH